MKIHVNPSSLISEVGTVVTIGSFDGVHCGHRAILQEVTSIARENSLDSALITIFPHPRKALGLTLKGFGVLNSMSEKEQLVSDCNIDMLVELEFTKEFRDLSAMTFAKKYLQETLNAKIVIIGYDHLFGYNQEGNYNTLVEYGKQMGFDVLKIPEIAVNKQKVSSTEIRNALDAGRMAFVNEALGYHYFISGELDKSGILHLNDEMKLLPPNGEYEIYVNHENKLTLAKLLINNDIQLFFYNDKKTITGKVKIIF